MFYFSVCVCVRERERERQRERERERERVKCVKNVAIVKEETCFNIYVNKPVEYKQMLTTQLQSATL